MASFDTNRTAADLSGGKTTSFIASVLATFSAWNDARVTRNALSKLTARELDDIGLNYGDIDAIATRTAR